MNQQKPKVLLIGTLPPPYIGPSLAMANILASGRIRDQYSLIFCDISDPRDLLSLGRFDWVNLWLALVHISKCLCIMLWRRPDIVYFGISQGIWGYLRDLGFFIPAVLLRRRIVIHLRGSEFDAFYSLMPQLLQWGTRLLFRHVTCVIVLSRRLKHVFSGLVPEDRIVVVPNGIDCAPFGSGPQNGEGKPGEKRILWLSNLFARKGIVQFSEALPEVFKAHPEAQVTVAGEWESPILRDRVFKFLEHHGVLPRVAFVGRAGPEDKVALLRRHDAFVLTPIEPEGMPWSILEAMSASLPVISTDQGAISDMVLDGKTGFIVKPEVSEIAKRINYLLSYPDEARRMGINGFNRVRSEFSHEAYEQRLVNVFAQAQGTAGVTPRPVRPAVPTNQSAG